MRIENKKLILENEDDINVIVDMIMSDESFDKEDSFIKNGKKYYKQSYTVEIDNEEYDFVVDVNWEDDSETVDLDIFEGLELDII
jgi:hypothetical protein